MSDFSDNMPESVYTFEMAIAEAVRLSQAEPLPVSPKVEVTTSAAVKTTFTLPGPISYGNTTMLATSVLERPRRGPSDWRQQRAVLTRKRGKG